MASRLRDLLMLAPNTISTAPMMLAPAAHFAQADATRLPLASKSVDLVFTSPPYLDARTYGINAQRGCMAWIEWMLDVVAELVRVSRGLVLINCAGVTRDYCYRPGPEGLLYEWWKRGGRCWRPAYWRRVGIPGSGGAEWLRSDVEHVLAFTDAEPQPAPERLILSVAESPKGFRHLLDCGHTQTRKVAHAGTMTCGRCVRCLAWSDNTANGHAPRYAPGGEMSYRIANGMRINGWNGTGHRRPNGDRNRLVCTRPRDGMHVQKTPYSPPEKANPGNVVSVKVGGGHTGHPLAHENEAPFPEGLAEWFITGWCPPGGIVLDPFSGSGTTACVAERLGRVGLGLDLRHNQCELGIRRHATPHAKRHRPTPKAKGQMNFWGEAQ